MKCAYCIGAKSILELNPEIELCKLQILAVSKHNLSELATYYVEENLSCRCLYPVYFSQHSPTSTACRSGNKIPNYRDYYWNCYP